MDQLQKRPRGRAPKDKEWNYISGKWVEKYQAAVIYKRPCGAAPKGKFWNYSSGQWKLINMSHLRGKKKILDNDERRIRFIPNIEPKNFYVRRTSQYQSKKNPLWASTSQTNNNTKYWEIYNKSKKTKNNWEILEKLLKQRKEKRRRKLKLTAQWFPNNA